MSIFYNIIITAHCIMPNTKCKLFYMIYLFCVKKENKLTIKDAIKYCNFHTIQIEWINFLAVTRCPCKIMSNVPMRHLPLYYLHIYKRMHYDEIEIKNGVCIIHWTKDWILVVFYSSCRKSLNVGLAPL